MYLEGVCGLDFLLVASFIFDLDSGLRFNLPFLENSFCFEVV